MSQHDFDISNQSFPATRSDLNNALKALASTSSGSSDPSTLYANQLFYSESTNTLYIRNEANSGWIKLAELDQTNGESKFIGYSIQAVDAGGFTIKTDDGTTRITVADSGDVTIVNDLTVDGGVLINTSNATPGNGNTAVGAGFRATTDYETLFLSANSTNSLRANRNGAGTVAAFANSGTTTAQIVNVGSYASFSVNSGSGVYFDSTGALPTDGTGSQENNSKNLGSASYAWKDAYLTGELYLNAGYGSAAKVYGCRAWVSVDGTTSTIRESGNVSSLTDRGTGKFTVNFTTAFPDANYAAGVSASIGGADNNNRSASLAPASTSSAYLNCWQDTSAVFSDLPQLHAVIFR